MVLLHTIVGLIFIFPFLWYLIRHWFIYKSMRMSHYLLTGYLAMIVSMVVAISGIVLTYQAFFQTRISQTWDLVHIVTTFGL